MSKPSQKWEYHQMAKPVKQSVKAVLDHDRIALQLAVGAAPQAKPDQKARANTQSLRQLGIRAQTGRVDPIAMLGVQAKASANAVAPTKAQIIAESDGPEPTVMGYLKAFRKLNQ
jgi:hypothetical protein